MVDCVRTKGCNDFSANVSNNKTGLEVEVEISNMVDENVELAIWVFIFYQGRSMARQYVWFT